MTRERNEHLKTQNTEVIVYTDDEKYYGVFEDVFEFTQCCHCRVQV